MAYKVINGGTAVHIDLAEPDEGDFVALGYNNTGVVSGGAVTQSGTPNMTVLVAAAEIVINGSPLTKTAGSVTLDASTAEPRFDLIGWEWGTTGPVFKKGTPSGTNPVYPTFDPTTFCMTAAVYVSPGTVQITTPYIVPKQVAPPTSLQRNYAADTDIGLAFATPTKPTSFKALADGTISWVSSVLRRTADSLLEWTTGLTIKQPSVTDKALVVKMYTGATANPFEVQPDSSSTPMAWVDVLGKFYSTNFRAGAGTPEAVVTASRGTVYLNTSATDGNSALYVKTTDGVSTGWAPLAAYVASSQLIPVGSVMNWPGQIGLDVVPVGWLYCDGSEQPTATYANLSAFCGTKFGSASAGNFKLPDYRGKVLVGVDSVLATVPGVDYGAASITLSVDQMPSHVHNPTEAPHSHPQAGQYFFRKEFAYTPPYSIPINQGVGVGVDIEPATMDHSATTDVLSDPQGGGQPISLMQPSQSTNFIIKW